MAEKPEVAVRQLNTINIKHVESDLKMPFHEADFSVETEEEFEKNYKSWLKLNLINPYIKLLRFQTKYIQIKKQIRIFY